MQAAAQQGSRASEPIAVSYAHLFGITRLVGGTGTGRWAVHLMGAVINGIVYGDTAVPIPNLQAARTTVQSVNIKEGFTMQTAAAAQRQASTSASIQIRYTVPSDNNIIRCDLYSTDGKTHIKTLVQGVHASKGEYLASWNGKNKREREVLRGTYVAVLISNNLEVSRMSIQKP